MGKRRTDNTMGKGRRADNTMGKGKRTKGQTMIYKILQKNKGLSKKSLSIFLSFFLVGWGCDLSGWWIALMKNYYVLLYMYILLFFGYI
jgi:hypothetical protein